jgi:hypothetical protein
MNFNLTPAAGAMLGEAINEAFVVLFSGVEISVGKRPAFAIAPFRDDPGIIFTPVFYPALLLCVRGASGPIARNNGRLEVIGYRDNQMHRIARRRP